jgi:hypothetical protein
MRWIQPDSIIPDIYNSLDLDRYSYTRNNPIKYNDPSGHCPICIVAWVAANAWWLGPTVLGGALVAYNAVASAIKGDTQGVVTSILFAPVVASGIPEVDSNLETRLSTEGSITPSEGIAGDVVKTTENTSASIGGESPLLYRSMKMNEDGAPEVGPTGRTLGARVPPNKFADIKPDENGIVYPNTGGMSASPNSVYNLGPNQKPVQFGGNGKDPVWCIYECDLGPNLRFNQNSSTHGFIEPAYPMNVDKYQQALAATRNSWHLFYDPN